MEGFENREEQYEETTGVEYEDDNESGGIGHLIDDELFDDMDEDMKLVCPPEGEYLVRITGAKKDKDGNYGAIAKDGRVYIMLFMEIDESEPDSVDYLGGTYFVWFPNKGQSPKEIKKGKGDIQRFCETFGLEFNELKLVTPMFGFTGRMLVKEGEYLGESVPEFKLIR